ncbi:UNKNOWN [Stylonychia lemnae]|uniref:Uncharacterized protein n=1 Tax=Stylonychia lemnae TaxID=5949 RepID=A0A078B6D2_STYLE|nr:UNKNOWN [Stylonychia lemnae]|eukprot:CDW88867.1 UNKNOWN [Stylonychia lemnae]
MNEINLLNSDTILLITQEVMKYSRLKKLNKKKMDQNVSGSINDNVQSKIIAYIPNCIKKPIKDYFKLSREVKSKSQKNELLELRTKINQLPRPLHNIILSDIDYLLDNFKQSLNEIIAFYNNIDQLENWMNEEVSKSQDAFEVNIVLKTKSIYSFFKLMSLYMICNQMMIYKKQMVTFEEEHYQTALQYIEQEVTDINLTLKLGYQNIRPSAKHDKHLLQEAEEKISKLQNEKKHKNIYFTINKFIMREKFKKIFNLKLEALQNLDQNELQLTFNLKYQEFCKIKKDKVVRTHQVNRYLNDLCLMITKICQVFPIQNKELIL